VYASFSFGSPVSTGSLPWNEGAVFLHTSSGSSLGRLRGRASSIYEHSACCSAGTEASSLWWIFSAVGE
jgi:hypothetical protein